MVGAEGEGVGLGDTVGEVSGITKGITICTGSSGVGVGDVEGEGEVDGSVLGSGLGDSGCSALGSVDGSVLGVTPGA